ncbi:hypothetical protein ACEOUJ_27580, partial [Pseudomonas aeruginosa]
ISRPLHYDRRLSLSEVFLAAYTAVNQQPVRYVVLDRFLAAYTAVNQWFYPAELEVHFLAAYTAVNVEGDVYIVTGSFLSCLYGSELDQKTINLPSSKGSSAKARKNPLFAAISNPLI